MYLIEAPQNEVILLCEDLRENHGQLLQSANESNCNFTRRNGVARGIPTTSINVTGAVEQFPDEHFCALD